MRVERKGIHLERVLATPNRLWSCFLLVGLWNSVRAEIFASAGLMSTSSLIVAVRRYPQNVTVVP